MKKIHPVGPDYGRGVPAQHAVGARPLKTVLGALLILPALYFLPKAYSAVDRTYEQIKILVDILDYIRDNYVEETETQELIYGAAQGMVRSLDDFSQFMEPREHKEMKTETEGQFGGLGIRIGIRDGYLTVITPLPGTPAYKAGVMPGDRIVKIQNEGEKEPILVDMQKWTLFDAVDVLRGKPGSKVVISVSHRQMVEEKETWSELQEITVAREWIKIQTTYSKFLDPDIAYLRLVEFTQKTVPDAVKELRANRQKGMRSAILDLRNNPGGLLSSAVEFSQQFLGQNKLIVYTQGKNPENRQEFRAKTKGEFEDIPLVVLVNGGSASGSEIVAGALQDHKRAIVIGSNTFGKASVQSVIPLADGSGLRLTVAKYYTPLGRSIQRDKKTKEGGIQPDIRIEVPREQEAKLQAQWQEIYTPGEESQSAIKKEEQVKDMLLERGIELLKARHVLSRLQEG
ncbi:MAG: S41 family peptidase [Elusimicrobia bacterium]|nr:S41 family peptidase [Elusimicrobiota bacterium]